MIDLIKAAFAEDLPSGDLTTDSLGIPEVQGQARLVAKQDLVLSGSQLFQLCINFQAPSAKISWQFADGAVILEGQIVALITGNLIDILKAERVGLNFLGRFSGIATLTRYFVDQIKGSDTKILDTRKTTPLFRDLEKKAVRDGGGTNHRMNLSDAVLIKDNHIAAAGGIMNAVKNIRSKYRGPIEVETQTLEDVKTAVSLDVRRILLDNMDNETLKAALELIPDSIETEASGNMTLERVRSVAALNVDFISVGALTHSAPVADLSLQFEWKKK